jgi:hypothetical protein
LAAKRLYRTAQGFSPGFSVARNPPCLSAVVSGNVGRRRKSGGRDVSLGYSRVIPPPCPTSVATFRAPF